MTYSSSHPSDLVTSQSQQSANDNQESAERDHEKKVIADKHVYYNQTSAVNLWKLSRVDKNVVTTQLKFYENPESSYHLHTQDHGQTVIKPYLACLVPCNQDVPGCQISVHKGFACQVLHARGYILAENKEGMGGVRWYHLSWSDMKCIRECLLEALKFTLDQT